MRIRPARPEDADQICQLHRASIRALCSTSYTADQISAWTEALQPDRYLSAMDAFEFLVAEDREIVGFCIVNLEGAELNAVYVHPQAAGHGVGTALMDTAEDLARGHLLPTLKLKSTLNAVGFYETRGFSRGCETMHRSPDGLELPCVNMVKELSTTTLLPG